MNQMQSKLRENAELFSEVKVLSGDNKIPLGLLWASKEEIIDQVAHFYKVLEMDSENESMPPIKFIPKSCKSQLIKLSEI